MKHITRYFNKKIIAVFFGGVFLTLLGIGVFYSVLHYTSSVTFCTSCHEMRFVAEQGWMESVHYQNDKGIVAECSDCHIPPEFFPKLWVKTRDGSKDVFVHIFGESDPEKMKWEELGNLARSKIYDSACQRCHINLTPSGASIKTITAHREYLRMDNSKKCLDCHAEEFHGRFKQILGEDDLARLSGGKK